MIFLLSLKRVLKLRDLEIFIVYKNEKILSYALIEDTRDVYTTEDKKLDPLCFMDEEDLDEILNVYRIYLINDETLDKEDSILLREYFSEFVNNNSSTNFIIKEYVQKDVYDLEDDETGFQKMLDFVGSKYKIPAISKEKWIYLSQD